MLGRTFLGCSLSCQRESEQIRNLLRSHLCYKEGQEAKLSDIFYMKFKCFQDIGIGTHLKYYVIIKGLVTNFQQI